MTLKDLEQWIPFDENMIDTQGYTRKGAKIVKVEDIKADIKKTCKELLDEYKDAKNITSGIQLQLLEHGLMSRLKALMEWAGVTESELE